MGLSNDERGWILTSLSAIACIVGALIICVDVIVRLFPKGRGFRIQNSNGFLSCSLSLSAGVMLFSSMYSILPSAKSSLQKGDLSSKAAAWTLIGCFLAGIFGINFLSRIFHHFIPSHVVDCDHTHGDEEITRDDHDDHGGSYGQNRDSTRRKSNANGHPTETTALLSSENARESNDMVERPPYPRSSTENRNEMSSLELQKYGKPSLQKRVTSTVSSLVTGTKVSCDEGGPCYGYTDPCGQDCLKNSDLRRTSRSGAYGAVVGRVGVSAGAQRSSAAALKDSVSSPAFGVDEAAHFDDRGRRVSMSQVRPPSDIESHNDSIETKSEGQDIVGLRRQSTYKTAFEARRSSRSPSPTRQSPSTTPIPEARASNAAERRIDTADSHSIRGEVQDVHEHVAHNAHSHGHGAGGGQHHHHVPTNAFLSLGLQTSIAIALHKLPEGFITYATNHANPSLGFSVFLALFIHNITEGFALALPLYLATRSRAKALFYTLILGGLSQPLGAAVAAVWLRAAEMGRGEYAPGDRAYGIMFALTAGVMTSVGLSLLQEGFELSHNRRMAATFVFAGMGILGISGALTA